MANKCYASAKFCRLRVTRIDATGAPAPGPNNAYVTDKPISVGFTPVLSQGTDAELRGGCDCVIASRKGDDFLKRWTLQLDLGTLEPALLEMLTGGSAIMDPLNPTDVIGVWWPTGIDCGTTAARVAVEGWTELWDGDAPALAFTYGRFLWPSVRWTMGQGNLQADFLQPQLNGETQGNLAWGPGPYGDQPEDAQANGGFWYTNALPSASCDYINQPVT